LDSATSLRARSNDEAENCGATYYFNKPYTIIEITDKKPIIINKKKTVGKPYPYLSLVILFCLIIK
jgi:hypothetical protein